MTSNEIWAVAETRNGVLTRVTSQCVGAAMGLAAERGLTGVAVLLGGSEAEAGELAQLADKVLWLRQPAFDSYEAGRQVAALAALVEQRAAPSAIIGGATSAGSEFMPRLAARLRGGYLSSCVALWWAEKGLGARRPVYGGKVYEEVVITAPPAVVTIRSGAFPYPGHR